MKRTKAAFSSESVRAYQMQNGNKHQYSNVQTGNTPLKKEALYQNAGDRPPLD